LTKKESAIFSDYPADRRFRKFISKNVFSPIALLEQENEAAENQAIRNGMPC
jgi:hypothetical protein